MVPFVPPASAREGGSKRRPWRYCLTIASASARSSGVKSIRCSSVMSCWSRGGGLVGNGCVGEYHSPGTPPFATGRPLFDRPHGLPGHAIEDKQRRVLGQLGDGLYSPTVDRDVEQNGRCIQIPIPDVVMNDLIVPDSFPDRKSVV